LLRSGSAGSSRTKLLSKLRLVSTDEYLIPKPATVKHLSRRLQALNPDSAPASGTHVPFTAQT
jgi:hypothetical protein